MRLGKRQIECMEQFSGHEPRRFQPDRFERPWPVMIRLSELGLLWIEKRLSGFWDPARGEWVRQGNGRSMFAGLTQKGEEALAAAKAGPPNKGRSGTCGRCGLPFKTKGQLDYGPVCVCLAPTQVTPDDKP